MLVPNNAFPPLATVPANLAGLAGFVALTAARQRGIISELVTHGATAAFNHMALNLFISNLCPTLRDELLKARPVTLYAAFQQAITLEQLSVEPKRATLPAISVTVSTEEATPVQPNPTDSLDDLDRQIDALHLKRRNLQQRSSNRSSNQHPPFQSSASNRYATRDTVCHYCKKAGHYQIYCRSRKLDNAPCVRTSNQASTRPPGNGPAIHTFAIFQLLPLL